MVERSVRIREVMSSNLTVSTTMQDLEPFRVLGLFFYPKQISKTNTRAQNGFKLGGVAI